MIFLSELLRQHVYDAEEKRVGRVHDVCISLNETFPVVTALVLRGNTGSRDIIVPWKQIRTIEEFPIHLTVKQDKIDSYIPADNELLLKRDILDKQIVDTQGFRVVKVNDLKLAQIKKTGRLVGVDISLSGLLRRLGLQAALDKLNKVMPRSLEERTITWNYVEPIQVVQVGAGQTGAMRPVMATSRASTAVGSAGIVPQVQLNVSHTKLADLHPADIADILEQLDVDEAGAMLDRLDMETAADALNEVEQFRQGELLGEMTPERASDLLERMPPDDAADILANLPQKDAEYLLDLMPEDESQPIRDLLRYGARTAGGIMTPEVLSLQQDFTVEETLRYLRQHSEHLEMVYYLYVVDEERHLRGVVSLRQLVVADPSTRIDELMDEEVIRVNVDTDQEEVADLIAKYDLLGVPVVDAENRLVGLVTVDDVIDVIHEEQAEDISEFSGADVEDAEEEEHFSWKEALQRTTWLGVSALAGLILALVVLEVFQPMLMGRTALASMAGAVVKGQSNVALGSVLCLLPMLLLVSGSAGSQALGVAGWNMRTKKGRDFWRRCLREIGMGTFGGVLICLVVCVLSWLLFHSWPLSLIVGLGFGLALLVAYACGLLLPNLLQRLHLRGGWISAPLLDPVIAVLSVCIFLAITVAFVEQWMW
ncbi:Mg2+ transporter MgtE [Thermosporothrix hazakensis]|jgi:Mg2+ transporter MgtE|uniref:Magnesium transporter MgtE n=2 Tax=Thermosporothrix TaxID=768650 RepID=A0A326TS19_THEHA|nr:magnesium transporter [Thermosporothrix hazakensis]PZW19201.1 Mg2+ transporter MgtE [Thermosporothrix hazakensis]BBH89716.1 hypothetical protein KTC_44670 [Thermosporothrix sp. COM3]GCE47903.1 hypothetical protein KTH_27720 [Thermosporothrix hazakensis]